MNPLDDIFSEIGLPTVRAVSSRRREQQSFSPEEQDSLLRRIGSTALSGIGAVGNLLDIPGSMVRDTISGHNPFDQLLSPFSGDNRQTGRDVLATWGVTTPNDPTRWEAADFGGFGAEVLLDPLTYLTFGASALGKGGQVAKNSGLLNDLAKVAGKRVGPREARLTTTLGDLLSPRLGEEAAAGAAWNIERGRKAATAAQALGVDDLAAVADQPLGGLFGVGLPFQSPASVHGSVDAARRLDELGRRIQFAKIPGTDLAPVSALNRLLSAKTGDAASQVGQRDIMPDLFRGRQQARAEARGTVADLTTDLLSRGGALAGDDNARALRRVYEGVDVAATPELADHVDRVRGVLDPMTADAREWGMHGSELFDSRVKYFPRYLAQELRDKATGKARIVSTFDPQNVGRNEFLKNLGQGTDTIQQMLEHPEIRGLLDNGAGVDAISDAIGRNFAADVPPQFVERTGGNSQMTHIAIGDRREALAKWFSNMDEPTRAAGVFGNHPMQDLAARLVSGKETLEVGKRILTQLADPDTLRQAAATSRTPGEFVPLRDVLGAIGFVPGTKDEGALKKFLSLSGQTNIDDKLIDGAAKLPIPRDLAEDLTRYVQGFKGPEAANEIIKAVDSVTNLFKAGVTSPWPAFAVRNLFSGQWQNLAAGQWSAKSLADANGVMRGRAADVLDIPIVRQELHRSGLAATAENAADVVRRLAYQYDVVGKYESRTANAAGNIPAGSTLSDLVSEMPGGVMQGMGTPFQPTDALGMLRGQGGTTWNPLNAHVRGGFTNATDTTFAPMAAGQHLGHYIEGLNRLTPFIENLRKGVAPAEAAARVAAAQVNYAGRNYTKFQNQVLFRVLPFGKFTTGMVPYTLRRLWEKPGGALAQTIRAENRASGGDASTPDYISDTASIPIGQAADGTKRYITGFGLPLEDPLSFLGGGVRGGLMEAASRLNPVLKAPLEWATGESFFQKGPEGGRDLEDMDPVVGRFLSNVLGREKPVDLPDAFEFIASNSPAARLLSTLRTASDPHKRDVGGALNLLTGVRVSDVSPAAQDAVIRERTTALMKELGAKSFARIYFPKDDVAQMTPEQQAQAIRLQLLQNILADRAKERKAAAAAK